MPDFQWPWSHVHHGRVFVSYRRQDTQWVAGRLADTLANYFGNERVFRDIEDIGGGADFGDVLQDTLDTADAMIVLIGDGWLNATDKQGNRRLENQGDWVGREVAAAIDAGTPVFPVLVDGVSMPRSHELPDSLKRLSRYNSMSLSDKSWNNDVNRIAGVIAMDIPSVSERKLYAVNLLVSLSLSLSLVITTAIVVLNLLALMGNNHPLPDWLSHWLSTEALSTFSPIGLAQSGISYVVIAWCSLALFFFSQDVLPSKRKMFLAAAWVGAVGSLISFVLVEPIFDPYEPLFLYFGSTTIGLAMFALLNLSGFRSK